MASGREFDWTAVRVRYVTGDESFVQLGGVEGYPGVQAIRDRSAREHWPELRRAHREQVEVRARLLMADDLVGVRRRHLAVAREMLGCALERLGAARAHELSVRDALLLAKEGADIERKILGLETLNVRGLDGVDLLKASDEQLAAIGRGEDPRVVLGGGWRSSGESSN